MPLLEASAAEFRFRPWIFGALFVGAFGLYSVDPLNAGVALLRVFGGFPQGSHSGDSPALQALFVVGALVACLGIALRTWAAAYLSSGVVHDASLHSDRLVADGPYRHLRNPLYLGVLLLAIGMAPIASRLGALVLVGGCWWFVRRLIGREEHRLAESQGSAFTTYRSAVPSLWPSIRPRLPAAGHAPRWGQAILGEAIFWLIALGVALFAATHDPRVLKWCGEGGLALYLVLFTIRSLVRRRAA